MKCKDCKYCDFKDKWNGEDYTRTYYCSKRHKIRFLLRKGCKHYEEYIPKPYVEQFTKCDKCEYLSECNSTIDITIPEDSQKHFICGRGGYCKKEQRNLGNKKLSDVIALLNKKDENGRIILGDYTVRRELEKAIEIYGDITYDEFIIDYNKVHKVANSI